MTFPTTNAALARALVTRGYTVPTAVQLAVLDAEAAGRDLLVSAQTGSGKTVAFGLSLGETLLGDAERIEPATAPLALVIAPTRELAMQVCRELDWLYEETGARVIACVGGMDARAEARQLEAGAHIVVGTPGRLRDHLERRRLDLSQLKVAVLDEADEMLNLGFREDLEFILDATAAERRTLLFSATLPREIETLAGRYQRDAMRIQTVRRDEQHGDIDYIAHRVSPQDVEHAVVNVLRLHEARAALVFCSTREAVNRYSARLLERGFSAVALSGELTQHERTQALQSLRDGRARVLVATDVAARGLDLPDLALVVHAELPNDAETLLHRSGRTGRAGKKGQCVLIVPYNRRRKMEALMGGARLKVTWAPAPKPEEIRARDQERFIADAAFSAAPSDDEQRRIEALKAARTADEIALALIRVYDARLPAPEDIADDAGPPPRREWAPRDNASNDARPRQDRFVPRGDREDGVSASFRAGPRTPRPRRDDGREMVWFRLNIGRDRNADPRWLLPLICRAGGVTKSEIGVIRIEDNDTRFQIVAEHADQFDHAVRTNKNKEGHIVRADSAMPISNPEVSAPTDAIPAPGKSFSPRDPAKAAPHTAPKDRGKPKWADRGKEKAGKWSPRDRDDKASAPYKSSEPYKGTPPPAARPAEPVPDADVAADANRTPAKPFPPRDSSKRGSHTSSYRGEKPKWGDRGKEKSGKWSPRDRDAKSSAPYKSSGPYKGKPSSAARPAEPGHRSEANAAADANRAPAKSFPPRDSSKAGPYASANRGGKPKWADRGKASAGKWSPRDRNDKGSSPYKGKQGSAARHGDAGSSSGAKFAKKKPSWQSQK